MWRPETGSGLRGGLRVVSEAAAPLEGSLDSLACAVGGGADTLAEAAEFIVV